MRISIINWTGDRQNWGCQATSLGLVEDVREALGAEPDLHFVPLGKKTTADRWINKLFVGFLKRYLSGAGGSDSLFLSLNRAIYGEHVAKLKAADAVLFMAEGTMTGEGFFGGVRLLMLPYLAARQFGKPVVSLNQTIFSANPDFLPLLLNVYRSFRAVEVREPASLHYAHHIGLAGAQLFPDSAYRATSSGAKLSDVLETPPTAPLLCVTASGGYPGSYQLAYAREAFEFGKANGLQICGLYWQPPAIEALRKIHAEIGGLGPVFPKPGVPYRDISAVLEQSEMLIGGRYHTAIQAAAVHTPFVTLPSGTHKTAGLLELLKYPLPERQFEDLEGIRSDLAHVHAHRAELAASLAAAMTEVQGLRQMGIERLRTYLRA
jgi:hypothetical protein